MESSHETSPSGRYARQTMLPEIGPEGQRRLRATRVLIVGLGGLGAPAATYLAGAGTGHIILCDPDTVSLSNLQRQTLYTEADLGKPKAECALRRLKALNSEISFSAVSEGITPENAARLVADCDMVVDCTDNFATRYLIDDTCAAAGRPWVYGAIGEFCGQVAVMNLPPRARRFSDLFPDREALLARPRTTMGVLGAVPGAIGAIQACEAIKVITGCGEPLAGRLFFLDLLSLRSEIIEF